MVRFHPSQLTNKTFSMGKYINTCSDGTPLPAKGKAKMLIEKEGAVVANVVAFRENLVCVVDSGAFEAAGYMYDRQEFEAFSDTNDRRPKTWLVVPTANELAR